MLAYPLYTIKICVEIKTIKMLNQGLFNYIREFIRKDD